MVKSPNQTQAALPQYHESNENQQSWRTTPTFCNESGKISLSQKKRNKNGVNPSQFHNHNERAPEFRAELDNILLKGKMKVVHHQKQDFTTKLKLRRQAQKESGQGAADMFVFPLQEPAFDKLRKMLKCHLHLNGVAKLQEDEENDNDHANANKHGDSDYDEDQYSCDIWKKNIICKQIFGSVETDYVEEQVVTSSSSLDEPKRFKNEQKVAPESSSSISQYSLNRDNSALTPSKCKIKQEFYDAFNCETEIGTGIEQNSQEIDSFLPALWSCEPRIFSKETSNTGRRKYIVGSYGRIVDHYWRKVTSHDRHFYELIPESTPCRLYFDIEFEKSANTEISCVKAEGLLSDFIDELIMEIQSIYSILISRKCIVDLDSSTSKKFSRHLIIHFPAGHLFADVVACGIFVKNFVGRLAEEIATGNCKSSLLSKYLFVKCARKVGNTDDVAVTDKNNIPTEIQKDLRQTKLLPNELSPHFDLKQSNLDFGEIVTPRPHVEMSIGATTCFIDMGVYTRNRVFRILGSTKFGKPSSAALRIADANEFPFHNEFDNSKFYFTGQQLTKSRTNSATQKEKTHEINSKGNQCIEETNPCKVNEHSDLKKFKSAVDWSSHAEALAQTLVIPLNSTKLKIPILPDLSELTKTCSWKPNKLGSNRPSRRKYGKSSTGPSPFPCIDDFILKAPAKRGGVEGQIRCWSAEYFVDGAERSPPPSDQLKKKHIKLLTYQISRNRWCEFIGRSHKSNGIMWMVDLKDFFYWQACHDPDCRAMRFVGKVTQLPDDLQEKVRDTLLDEELAYFDENIVVQHKVLCTNTSNANNNMLSNDIDELEFEKALLALDISAKDQTVDTAKVIVNQNNSVPKLNTTTDEETWDEALTEAMFNDPDRFP